MTKTSSPRESLIAIAGIQVTGQSLEKTLGQILELACGALTDGDEGGITLLAAEGPVTAVATSEAARRIDCSQYAAETGGPSLDAYRQQQIVRIDSTASDRRWPQFSGTAAAAGIASALSVPLVVGGDGLGATGILMARQHCSAERARHLLAAAAQCNRLTLAEVAADQVRRTGSEEQAS